MTKAEQRETLALMSGPALRRAIEKADARSRRAIDLMIACGRGNELPTQTRAIVATGHADWLSIEYMAAADACSALSFELRSRREYHGTDRPIKRNA